MNGHSIARRSLPGRRFINFTLAGERQLSSVHSNWNVSSRACSRAVASRAHTILVSKCTLRTLREYSWRFWRKPASIASVLASRMSMMVCLHASTALRPLPRLRIASIGHVNSAFDPLILILCTACPVRERPRSKGMRLWWRHCGLIALPIMPMRTCRGKAQASVGYGGRAPKSN